MNESIKKGTQALALVSEQSLAQTREALKQTEAALDWAVDCPAIWGREGTSKAIPPHLASVLESSRMRIQGEGK